MNKIEMHFHTKETSPCGMVAAAEAVTWFYNEGYQGIVVTDHFSVETLGSSEENEWVQVIQKFLMGYREAKKKGEELGMHIYLGMEIRFLENMNDYLVYGITKESLYRYPWMYERNLEEFRSICEREGWCIVQAHPFRKGCKPARIELLDGIEIHNANPRHDSNNSKALELAEMKEMIMTVGSDFHREGDVSGCGVLFEQIPNDESQLVESLINKKGMLYR